MTAPLCPALDPTQPHSLVALTLADLPATIVESAAVRRLKLVKTLPDESGPATEVQFYIGPEIGMAVRSAEAVMAEFDLGHQDRKVLRALTEVVALDMASLNLALQRVFRGDVARLEALQGCDALRLNAEARASTEQLSQRYCSALFGSVLADGESAVRSTAELTARLNAAARSGDVARLRAAQAQLDLMCRHFQLSDPLQLIEFFNEFDLLVSAVCYYRKCFLELEPFMLEFHAKLDSLRPGADVVSRSMLRLVDRHLMTAHAWMDRFFQAFDRHFDDVVDCAEPHVFRDLNRAMQEAYATIGGLVCAWGLRFQAIDAIVRQRQEVSSRLWIETIRLCVCRHLPDAKRTRRIHRPDSLRKSIQFLTGFRTTRIAGGVPCRGPKTTGNGLPEELGDKSSHSKRVGLLEFNERA